MDSGSPLPVWRQPRARLWALAGVVTLGFLVALEIAAHHYGLPGPMASQAKEVVVAPKSGFLLYSGMALMMLVLTWRQRFIAFAAAIGIDLAFLVVRWAAGIEVTDGHPFGNGALWVLLGVAVIAVTRRTGRERALLLKGVGLGLLLVAGRKTGDTWLLITSKSRPMVLDQYVAVADHALGNPSWLVGGSSRPPARSASTFSTSSTASSRWPRSSSPCTNCATWPSSAASRSTTWCAPSW